MKKLFTAVLFVVFSVAVFGQAHINPGGFVTIHSQEGPEFERLRQAARGFAPAVHYFLNDTDGAYLGGGSNGEVTMFMVSRPQGFGSSKVWAYIDTDNNPDTGRSSARVIGRKLDMYEAVMGIDHMVDLSDASSGRAALYDAFGDFLAYIPASADGVSITFQIPVFLVGGDGSMDVAVLVNDAAGQDWIPNKGFLAVWEPSAAIVPTSSPSPKFSLIFQDQQILLVASNPDKLKIFGVAASLNSQDLTLEKDSNFSTSETEVYRVRDFNSRLTMGLFSPNRLSFGMLTERGFFSRSTNYIVVPALK